ncbi:lytic transglycosylase domain-containing protein [Roseovarius rhodophyticola]|uniref:Lytic transglycosylase domain-containing protein n=1 Tax=Roseovarius rhodophyticola TaxID=3080827 RepID=A0ABZ2TC17_9RHOB|nr:lytic transglycosylase domain-containing protein [Roseovarius sp. W115]MDV2930930.1 lytic transglycosylase domain-containing protein [Roseovarius sp. W115]
MQVDPDAYFAYLNPEPKPETSKREGEKAALPSVPVTKAAYDWFWTKVPPGQDEEATKRLRTALNTLADGPDGQTVKGPRLQHLQKIAQVEGANILKATIGTDVSPALVLAVIAVESGGKVQAESHAGAQGVMQLMPATAERFGVADSFVSADNIKGGVAYLDWLLKEFDGDAVLALAGYNAGENAVKKHEGVPPFAETRDYVPKVLAAFQVARGLCKTQPELVTDACALTIASN